MSNLERRPGLAVCGGRGAVGAAPVRELLPGRRMPLGESTEVHRLLPTLGRRMVGAWCFADHYGPDNIAGEPGMRVPPHPHTGLQTVSWLLSGSVLHRDSLGSEQLLRPGQLGLMTAGRAISHAEESPPEHERVLHGAQLWVALPDAHRFTEPAWEFHADPPGFTDRGMSGTVLLGELAGLRSPATTHTPLVGVDLRLAAGTDVRLPVERDFEYAVFVASGAVEVDDGGGDEPGAAGVPLRPGPLLYLGCGRSELALRAGTDSRLLVLGGEPFEERIVMWWNFVGRTAEEIAGFRAEWQAGGRFGAVRGYPGEPLAAPPLPATRLVPRGRER